MDDSRRNGAYYTSRLVAEYMVNWALRTGAESMLEPSFGDGAFIRAALERYAWLGAAPDITGVELRREAFVNCREAGAAGVKALCRDFLTWEPRRRFSAIVGNPPYVSLRSLDGAGRASAIASARRGGVELSGAGSLWAPFVVHSTALLKDGGRLALVLPFELAYVRYAGQIWKFLGENYGELTVMRIYERLFPQAEVETVILLADDRGGSTGRVSYAVYGSVDKLLKGGPENVSDVCISEIVSGGKPFALGLLSREQRQLLERLRRGGQTAPIAESCKFSPGYVCADKDFFHPDRATAAAFGLPERSMLPCLFRSGDIKKGVGAVIRPGEAESRLYLPPEPLSAADRNYIEYGESMGVHRRYKCRKRSPWYVTPGVGAPELLLTVFGDVPKLVVNGGGYVASNIFLSGRALPGVTPEQLVCRWYNSLTLLSIELNVRSLGGGVLVMIPGETDRLEIAGRLPEGETARVFSQLDRSLREEGAERAYLLGDLLVLNGLLGLDEGEIREIRAAVQLLRAWRRPDRRRGK